MSTVIELMKNTHTIVLNTIKPQFLQIINLEIVKYVNTGDRVKDGAIVVIMNAIVSIIMSVIYYVSLYCYNKIRFSEKTNKIDVQKVLEKYKQDQVMAFKFTYILADINYNSEISMSTLINYVNAYNKVTEINTSAKTDYTQATDARLYDGRGKRAVDKQPSNIFSKGSVLVPTDVSGRTCRSYFFPFESYIDDYGEEKYIFIINGMIASESLPELEKCILKILDYCFDKSDSRKKINVNELQIDEFSEEAGCSNKIGLVNKNVTFDTLVLEHKEILIEWLNKYATSSIYPSGLALTNKLGILVYGPPGSGKTGCIIATANYLKKNVLLINTLCLRQNMLRSIKNIINTVVKTHIIVFEEFDYILSSNNAEEHDTNKDEIDTCKEILFNTTNAEQRQELLSKITELNKRKKTSGVDTRFILTLLDGIESTEDRLIFATTNNPHKINSLFLRPGRFDLVLKLGFCTFDMFKQLVMKKYKTLTNEFFETQESKINKILSLNVTPLVLINKLVSSSNEFALLDDLLSLKQSHYTFEPN
jgi:hypothetical protein